MFSAWLFSSTKKLFAACDGLGSAEDPDGAGPDKLLDAVLAKQFLECIDLVRIADYLQDKGLCAHIDNGCPEDGRDLHDLCTGRPEFGSNLDQGQFPFNPLAVGQVRYLDDID